MTILCEVDDMTRGSLGASLGDRAHVVTSLTAATVALAADPHEHVVVIGARVELDEALDFTQHVQREYDYIAVVLLRFSLEPEVLHAAQQAGVHEVAVVGDLTGVTAAITRAEAGAPVPEEAAVPPMNPQPRGGLVVVFAAKGGCGKTTLATNLATVLNDDGAHSVALVDLDLEFGDVAVALRLTPAKTLIDAVDLKRLDPLNIAAVLTPYRPNLDCVLAPVEPGDAERISVELVSQLLEALLATHEYVVIDTPSQLSEPVLAAMDMAHHFMLLTTPEITALKNLRLTLDMLDLLGYDPNARAIIFNRSDARAGLSAADIESAIKTPISVRIPSSYDVPASINKGVPLAQSNPKHPVSVAVREIADTQITGAVSAGQTSHRQSGRRSRKLRMRSS